MKKRQIVELLIIVVLGLVPLLWFHGNQVILGHDSGLTLSPISHFLDRLYPWTERFGFGNDQVYAIPGFFIHGLDALIALLGFQLQSVQKIAFIFWFVLPGLTMYYFSSKLSQKLNLKFFVLPTTVLYMFNHFLLQGWFVAERTKFSVYAALPLVMVFLFDWEEKRRSTFKTGLFMALTVFFLNGEASLPLFGGLILSVFAFIEFYLFKGFSRKKLKELGKLIGVFVLTSVALNAYWLFPYIAYILQSYSNAVLQAGGINGVLTWLTYVSQESSLVNIFRLQGIPEWYLNPRHPYAGVFLNNIFLIVIGFGIPIAAFLPLYLIKQREQKEKVIFFSFLALFSMIFIAGAHPPFGEIYIFLINFVPGFVAFRNPFYKFAPALWFSYAILIGFAINYLLQKIELRRKLLTYGLYLAFTLGIILYSYPFLNGVFFDYIKGERSMRVVVPQYIFDFGKWSDSKERLNTKVLALPPVNPDNKVDAYTWGYWSLSPLTSLLTNAPIVNESNFMSTDERNLTEGLYKMIKNNEPGWENLAKLLGIKSFLVRGDFAWDLKGSQTDNPSVYDKTLKSSSNLSLVKKFGAWEVFSFKDDVNADVVTTSKINYLVGDATDLGKIASLPFFDPKEPVYVSSNANKNAQDIMSLRNDLFLVPTCFSCNLQHIFINTDLYIPLITRGSIFYPLIEFKNKLAEKKLVKSPEKVNFYLYDSLRDILAFDKLVFENKDTYLLLLAISDYSKSLNNLDKSLKDYFKTESIDNNFLFEVSEVLGLEKNVVLFKNATNLPSGQVLDTLNKKYSDLKRIKDRIDKNISQTLDETNKKFLVNSNTDAQFEFLYKPKTVSTSWDKVNLTLDNRNLEIKTTQISAQWYALGKISLSKGLHRLIIKYPIENLYTSTASAQVSSLSDVCFSSNAIKAQKGDIYRVSFQHQRLFGSKKFFVRILPVGVKPNPLDARNNVLESASVSDNYRADYSLPEDQSFYLTVCSFPSADREDFASVLELKDINIRKIAIPEVVFYSPSSSKDTVDSNFSKKSQTEYTVSTDPKSMKKIVLLNESFNNNWIMPNAKDNIHFVANGYSNGWIVESANTQVIKYKAQDFVNIGFVLSFIALIASALYILRGRL